MIQLPVSLVDYFRRCKTPIWLECRLEELLNELYSELEEKTTDVTYAENEAEKIKAEAELKIYQEKFNQALNSEMEKLDRFYEILATTNKDHRQAEKEVYGSDGSFYIEYDKFTAEEIRKKERARRAQKLRLLKKSKKKIKLGIVKQQDQETEKPDEKAPKKSVFAELKGKLYLEKDLSAKQREALFAKGYRRLKVSPFGDSGAAYYWVRTRYNESKEHAFFCYLIEAELKKHHKKVEMNVNYGPDIVFKHNDKEYCFDVETGKNLQRHPEVVENKFMRYKNQYSTSFIFVTDKSLKYKYSRYGTVVTRSKLREILSQLLLGRPLA